MKALRQLGFLRLNLRPDGTPAEDSRVLALFRNRAELKKAYGGLQEETFRLKDLIKQQEAATQRAQEMLSALEGRLGSPETAYAALVFYQLRRLWQSGRELLTQFVADLARQGEERERRAHLAQQNRQQFARRQAAEEQLRAAQALHLEAGAQLAALESQRAALGRWWHYFKRRALAQRIDAAQAGLDSAGRALDEAQQSVEAIARESPAEFPGLSLPTRRAINLAAIAYAETLCLRLTELKAPLVRLAREATAAREAGNDYGTAQQCVLLMGQISRAQTLLAGRDGLTEEIRTRSERLKSVARYRSTGDSTPLVESLAFSEGDVLAVGALALNAAPLPNVLAEDTWDLFRVLLR
jgi:hypothetical protein